MHIRDDILVVFLLSLAAVAAPTTAASQPASPVDPETEQVVEPLVLPSTTDEESGTASADIDLGTATLDHGEFAIGPWSGAVGLFDRLMVGTYTFPWLLGPATSILTDKNASGIAPSAFVRVRLHQSDRFSASMTSSIFYGAGDLDDDGLSLRALAIPVRGRLGIDWTARQSTTLELGGVYATLTGQQLDQGDSVVHGVAIARSLYGSLVQRMKISDRFSVWGRARTLLGHAPVRASFDAELSESAGVNIRARADSAELSNGFSGAVGVHTGHTRYGLTTGVGYGTWLLPGLYMPVGQNLPFAEFNVYLRF